MNDFFAAAEHQVPSDSQNEPVTVSQLSNALRFTLEETFSRISIIGEVATLRQPGSGHIYFNLKDADNVLKTVVWRSTAARLKVPLSEGAQIVATGKISSYGPRSEYQLIADNISLAGEGALLKELAERKNRLAAEGLFDEANKQQLPFLPHSIGIITSPTGAVIEDMLSRLRARCPRPVKLWPVRVQGVGAAAEMIAAIEGFNAMPAAKQPAVLILARGGGSLEDLWEFNDEALVRAVAASAIPIISGVGHEPDVTLVDFAADLRAATPTAAMEHAVPVQADLLAGLSVQQRRLASHVNHRLSTLRQRVDYAARGLPQPRQQLTNLSERLTRAQERLVYQGRQLVKTRQQQLKHVADMLSSMAPEQVLKRGFTYVTAADGTALTSAKAKPQDITLHFADGSREAALK